jgi:hypothetical protein
MMSLSAKMVFFSNRIRVFTWLYHVFPKELGCYHVLPSRLCAWKLGLNRQKIGISRFHNQKKSAKIWWFMRSKTLIIMVI